MNERGLCGKKIKKYVCTLESLVYNNLVRTIFRQVRSDGMVAQPGERPPHTREVTGSSPVHPISFVPEPVRIRGFLVLYDYLQSALELCINVLWYIQADSYSDECAFGVQ